MQRLSGTNLDRLYSVMITNSATKSQIPFRVFGFLLCNVGLEHKMQQSGGLLRQPVQKLVASLICDLSQMQRVPPPAP